MDNIRINFKDYLRYALRHFVVILLVGIITGCIFFAAGYVFTQKMKRNYQKSYDAAVESYDEDMKEYENNVGGTLGLWMIQSTNYNELSKDLTASVYLNENFYNADVSKISIILRCKKDVSTMSKKTMYGLIMKGIEYDVNWAEMASRYGMDEDYLDEVLNYTIDYDAEILEVTVCHPSIRVSENIIANIIDMAAEKLEEYDENKEFILEFTDSSRENKTRLNNGYLQYNIVKNINDYCKNAEAYAEKLNEYEKPEEPVLKVMSKKRQLFYMGLFGIVGGFVGILIGFYLVYGRFARKGIVYSGGEYERLSGNYLLCDMSDKKKEELSDEDISRIGLFTRKYNKLVLVNASVDKLEEISKSINKKIKLKRFNYSDNKSHESVVMLNNSDAVIMVYRKGIDTLDTICEQNETMEKLGKKIIGCIVI